MGSFCTKLGLIRPRPVESVPLMRLNQTPKRGAGLMDAKETRCLFSPNCSYIVIGGLSTFGIELIQYMLDRNATKIVICCRMGYPTLLQKFRLQSWEKTGVEIKLSIQNIFQNDGCKAIFDMAAEMGPIAGIFHLALDMEMTPPSRKRIGVYSAVVDSHFQSVLLFDKMSRSRCPKLKHFVMFSLFDTKNGRHGTSAYTYASSLMEKLAEKRKKAGKPGQAVQWGPIFEVGSLSEFWEKPISNNDMRSIASCILALDNILLDEVTYVVLTYLSGTKV